MKQQTRSRIATGLERTGLLAPAERLREGWLSMRTGVGPEADAEGLPLPPPRLRLLVDGRSGDVERFLWIGAEMAGSIRAAVECAGVAFDGIDALLDFGCGSGRVARHWASLEGGRVHGCDYNEDLVRWCQDNLPFMETVQNQLEPPTPYESEGFDLIYTLSVLSHLDEDLQRAWVAEFRRLLRPGGLLIASVLGEHCRDRLTDSQRERFDRGELVVERPRMGGSNLCTAYHPPDFVVSSLLAEFVDVEVFDLGSEERALLQDAYIARRPA